MSGLLDITVACGDYDRTRALATGAVRVEGANIRYLALEPEEIFFRMLKYREFDVAEMSLSSYVLTLFQDAPFVALPVFPSRTFRHNGIYVNAASGITSPAQLAGRAVGVPEYQITAAVWIRGILAEHYGLPVSAVRYVTGGLHEAGRTEKVTLDLPPEISVQEAPAGTTLCELLLAGEIDALYSARKPRPFVERDPRIRRLFADPGREEEDYFRTTGIFPIMHTLVIRRDLYERHPWLARSLVKAFELAKRQGTANLGETNSLAAALPWLYLEWERSRDVFGADWWPYGVAPNEATLTKFLQYSYEQGLAPERLNPWQLFADQTHDSVRV